MAQPRESEQLRGPTCPAETELERWLADLSSEAEQAALEAHVGGCDSCSAWLAAARADEQLLPDLRAVEVPAGLGHTAVPAEIAGYRIVAEIGSGGMGIVYEAEQKNPSRRVALKVVRPGLVSPRTLRRFTREAAVLGRLQHPGIAQILEAGTFGTREEARPFFAMELVRGETLADFAARHRGDSRRRLELFIEICAAVQHAHEKGVVHRDLKPSNILVDSQGRPKVLDFGVARLQEDDGTWVTRHTREGQLIGTLAYMSPEQVRGDANAIDTRVDVYALGVTLYETLAGRLPHDLDDKSTLMAVRIIAEDEPTPLDSVDPKLRGDLATIVHKALAKEAARRYGSPGELAEELRRFCRHEPISARPPSTMYQLTKFVRRNYAVVAGVAGILVAMAAGTVVSVVQWRRADRAAALAHVKKLEAEHEAKQARGARLFLQNMLIQASPLHSATVEPTLRQVVDTALRRMDQLEDQPLVEASVRETLGRVLRDLDDFAGADQSLQRALRLWREAYGIADGRVADARIALAELRLLQGEFADARRFAEQVIATKLTGCDAAEASDRRAMALLLAGQASCAGGELAAAEEFVRASLKISLGCPDSVGSRLAACHGLLAQILENTGRRPEAERAYRTAIEMFRSAHGENHPKVVRTMSNLARFLIVERRLDEAEALLRKGLEISKASYGAEHSEVGFQMRAIGSLLCKRKRWDEGLKLMRDGISMQERTLGKTHPRVGQSLSELAEVCFARGEYGESLKLNRRCAAILTRAMGANHNLVLRAQHGVGANLRRLGRAEEAEKVLRDCLDRARKHTPWATNVIGEVRRNWILTLHRLGRHEQTRRELKDLAAEPEGYAERDWARRQLEKLRQGKRP